jgi:hypothetical protein
MAPGRAHWLKALGSAEAPLSDAWLEENGAAARRLTRTGFPRRPRIEPGDRLVYYASVWRRVFAVVEVVGDPTDEHPVSARWPWTVAVEPLLVVPRLENAPPVEAIGVPARSMSQQSHIRLRPEQYELAVEVLASVAG